jgi:serine protease Do
MTLHRHRYAFATIILTLFLAAPALGDVKADKLPENVDDLRALQKQVRAVLEKAVPCTVGIRMGSASGSGVIISKDGYVLTAGHVSGEPNRDVTVILPDGKMVKAKTLGSNQGVDAGLIKITDDKEKDREWPFVEMGKSAELQKGQWCIATGHPGGFRPGRTPPVRLGRILAANERLIQTDCTVVGGDSGGPLFDLDGKVIGIHSRIGGSIATNIHVPIDAYRDGWDRMAKAEVWGGRGNRSNVYMGVRLDNEAKDCKVLEVVEDSPAGKAGLKNNDTIAKFDGQAVGNIDDLHRLLRKKKPGDEVSVEVRRGEETVKLKVTLARRGG